MIGGFLGGLANLGGVVQGADKAQDAAIQRALYALSLQQAQQQQQSMESVYGGALNLGQGGIPGGIPGGVPQQLQMPGMPGGIPGGIPQQQQTPPRSGTPADFLPGLRERESNAGLPVYGGDSPGGEDSSIVKGSVFGNMPGWPDKMAGSTTASGRPVSDPGIALRIPKSSPDFGKTYDVTMPSGKTYQWPQTDYGPAAWTGRGVDISAGAAQQAGYTKDTFPTDQPIKIHPAVQQIVNQTGQEAIQAKLPPPAVRESSQAALRASSDLDPRRFGGYDVPSIAQAIEKATPNAPVAVKALALMQLHKLMAPDQQQLVRMEMQQARNELQVGLKEATIEMQRQSLEERRQYHQALEGRPAAGDTPSYQPFTTPGGGVVAFDTKSGRTKEIPELQGATKLGTEGRGASGGRPQSLSLQYPDGKTEEVYGIVQGPGKIVSVVTGQPIDLPQGTQITPLKAPGRQAASQINAMMGSSNEVVRAMNNLVDLPITATSGWFKGVTQHAPEQMAEALKRSLGNNITSEDSKAVIISFQGIQRAMATLEAQGRATGLVGLTQQASVLMPQEGDTGMDVLRKYAEIRQLTEAALDTLSASPDIGNLQRDKITAMEGKIKETVPWTVKDVNALMRDPSNERVTDFAKRFGAAGASGAAKPASSGPPYKAGDVLTIEGKQYRVTGGDPNDPDIELAK